MQGKEAQIVGDVGWTLVLSEAEVYLVERLLAGMLFPWQVGGSVLQVMRRRNT